MEKRPDYIGIYACYTKDEEHVYNPDRANLFLMWIQNRDGGDGKEFGVEKIKGKIQDSAGMATFDGTLGPDEIKKKKKYSPDIKGCIISDDLVYSGKKEGDSFKGRYFHPDNSVVFILEEMPQSRILEVLVNKIKKDQEWETTDKGFS